MNTRMNRVFLTIIGIFFASMSARSQDYYIGKERITTNDITYSIEYDDEDPELICIILENERNTLLSDDPFDKKKNEYCGLDWPWIHFPNESVVIKELVTSTLFPERRESYFRGSGILVHCAVNPETALIEEVLFDIHPRDNKRLLSIPPERFEELEKKLVGQNFGIKIPDRYKNLTYCICGVFSSFK